MIMGGKASGRLTKLRKRAEFARVYARGRYKAGRLLVLYGLPNGRDVARFGLVVGRGVGSAVVRNRVRRRLREICRRHRDAFKEGYDYVVVARQAAGEEDSRRLEQELLRAAKSIGVIKNA